MKSARVLVPILLGLLIVLAGSVILITTGLMDTESRKIVFSSDSAEQIYDGTALTCATWEIKEGDLHEMQIIPGV